MSPPGPSPYVPPTAPLQEPVDLQLERRRAPSLGLLCATYGLIGSAVALPLAVLGSSLLAESLPWLGGTLFWGCAAVASTTLPGLVLRRVAHPIARVALAPFLVGLVAALTGVWGALVAALHAAALGPTAASMGGGAVAVLGMSLLMAVYVAPLGLPIQLMVEGMDWAWTRLRRSRTADVEPAREG